MEIIKFFSRLLGLPLIALIVAYQKTFSPDHGFLQALYPYGYCRFHPTCSMYARQVLAKDGILGLPKIIRRLINCRPGVPAGIDLP